MSECRSPHARAVDLSRELSAANPSDYELRFALACWPRPSAPTRMSGFARSAAGRARAADLAAAEAGYGAAHRHLPGAAAGR